MFLSAFFASFRPCQAEALNDLSLMPPVSVTTHALNDVAAPAVATPTVLIAPTVNEPATMAAAPKTTARRRERPLLIPCFICPSSWV